MLFVSRSFCFCHSYRGKYRMILWEILGTGKSTWINQMKSHFLKFNHTFFDLFIASRTPGIEKFNAYNLAKAHNFLREMMKKILWEVYTAL